MITSYRCDRNHAARHRGAAEGESGESGHKILEIADSLDGAAPHEWSYNTRYVLSGCLSYSYVAYELNR